MELGRVFVSAMVFDDMMAKVVIKKYVDVICHLLDIATGEDWEYFEVEGGDIGLKDTLVLYVLSPDKEVLKKVAKNLSEEEWIPDDILKRVVLLIAKRVEAEGERKAILQIANSSFVNKKLIELFTKKRELIREIAWDRFEKSIQQLGLSYFNSVKLQFS